MNNKQTSACINRREALRIGTVAVVGAAAFGSVGALAAQTELKIPPRMPDSDWSLIRGFNYQPSYGGNGFELWQKFDAKTIAAELAQGKRFFPKMNTLRWWQSWDSFQCNPERYSQNFDTTLQLAEKIGCRVIPCLFNRWHDSMLDYGGTYIDHFLPKVSWIQKTKMFDPFLETLVGRHKNDSRILAWDLCNEPYAYSCPRESIPDIVQSETAWLKSLYEICKGLDAQAPITVGIHPGVPLEMVDSICDVLSIHPYWTHNISNPSKEVFEKSLDRDVAFALKTNKPLLATECCWGSLDDKVRVESIRYTLTQLKQRNIGYTVYLLHHSLIADAHRIEFGPLGEPGNLAFIEADGTLRPGHGVFNEF